MDQNAPASRTPLARLALIWGIGGFALTAALMGGMSLSAQSIASHDSKAPVTYDAGKFVLDDRANQVIFSGGVIVNQADLRIQSDRMLVNFTDAGSLEIQRITATGGVVITRGDERASGDNAIYDFNRRIITMAGNVRLRRGTDTLNGGRLVIDLASGLSTVDGTASGSSIGAPGAPAGQGRVTGSFTVPQKN
ncbi:lipopolysaccharide export system protein LptA [Erythromicrobium ramosum]|jgi:lipopolysaccharide export system protein LptA|uniref:Lipopolysaccharide export system protein LptA n=1 Tax=Erythrobacter ramosus TaxID=35811 RepID=A0A6I4UK12_9SPHN|nr:LptA/OstA family protein [Erythrobacter ramosus]MBB3774545.1 lipopolysaccharide export system protein LptA [Erythrobacter ramosus]MXP37805.1 OstA family protein [Erythrobacter ramosus]